MSDPPTEMTIIVRTHTTGSNGMVCAVCAHPQFGRVHHFKGPYAYGGGGGNDTDEFRAAIPYKSWAGYRILCRRCYDDLRMQQIL